MRWLGSLHQGDLMKVELYIHVGIGGLRYKTVELDSLPEVGQEMVQPLGHRGGNVKLRVYRVLGDNSVWMTVEDEDNEICHQEFDYKGWASYFCWPV